MPPASKVEEKHGMLLVTPEHLKTMSLYETFTLVISGTDWKQFIFADAKVDEGLRFVSKTFAKKATERIPSDLELPTAFVWTPFRSVRVVLIGQDPYPEPGLPVGASFSVRRGVPLPVSLHKLFDVYSRTLGYPKPTHGCLLKWAVQGVLLLNTALSVQPGMSNSQMQTWRSFSDPLVRALSSSKPLIWLLMGGESVKLKSEIKGDGHAYVITPHPVARDDSFLKSDPFRLVNAELVKRARSPSTGALTSMYASTCSTHSGYQIARAR